MLVWALWLAASLVRWTGWAWRAFGEGGLWQKPSLPGWLKPKQPAVSEAGRGDAGATEDEVGGGEPEKSAD